jgi:hypothetical protein
VTAPDPRDPQDRLEEALRGAGRADERELAARVRDEGRRLVFLLSGLVRSACLYTLDNDALAGPSAELEEVLGGLVEQFGMVCLVLVEDQAYLNDIRLRVRATEQPVVDQLSTSLARHETSGLTVRHRLSAGALRRLARAISGPAEGERPAAALRAKLAGLGDVDVSGRWRLRLVGEEETRGPRTHAEVLARAEAAVRDALARLTAGWMPNPLRIRRVVIDLVESLRADPRWAPLAPFVGQPGRGERHLISVCQLAVMLGRAVGLGDAPLSDLGVAALLHDVGYIASRDVDRHPLAGARILLRQRGFSEAKVRRLRAVLEHHQDAVAEGRTSPGTFGRLLHVVDDYDLLVAWRGGPEPPVSPATALRRMWSGLGTRYDTAALALFGRELGLYPPGTLLDLGEGSTALVVRAGRCREDWDRPLVRVLRPDPTGAPEEIDLAVRRELRVAGVVEPAVADPALVAAARAALS